MPDPYVASLGRISGQLLTANLQRNGVDLAVDTDLLYLKVSPQINASAPGVDDGDPNYGHGSVGTGIGINTYNPVFDLDVNDDILTKILTVTGQATISDVTITAPNTFGTVTSPLEVYVNVPILYHDRLTTTGLAFDVNNIRTFNDGNMIFDPNGSGTVEFRATTNITGKLSVSGNIGVSGNLSEASSITIGDQTWDTLTIVPDFKQSIIPGTDNAFDLGMDARDSSPRRWASLHAPIWQNVQNWIPENVIVSDQLLIDSFNTKITGLQSNDDIVLNPETGIVYIESTKWQDNTLTNMLDSPLTLASTGRGYTVFAGNNAMGFPAGSTVDQRPLPEVGETRWNTDLNYLECFDGTVWASSIGAGDPVTSAEVQELSEIYTLMLG